MRRRDAFVRSARRPGPTTGQMRRLLRGALGQDALQRAAVHVEPARRLRDVAVAHFIDALDVLPAHAIRRHRVLRWLGFLRTGRQQRCDNVVGVGRLGQVIDRAHLHRGHGGGDIAIAGEHNGACVRPLALQGRDDVEADIGDLADLDRARAYDLVLVPREGFQFVSPLRNARSIIDSLGRVVRPGGRLILDCFDFLGAQIWSPADTPRYFRATQDAPASVTEVVLRPASGRLLQRRTVAESVKDDPIEFTSIYALEGGYAVHRDFLMAQYAERLLQAYGHAAGLILEAVNRGYGLTGTPNAGDTGRRVVVFRRVSYGLLR